MSLSLARGAGMKGLAGIPPRRDNVIRPILFAQRGETEAYCRTQALPFLHDPCNEDLSYARNRVRQNVVPELEAVNPQAVAHAATAADILRQEDHLLDALAGAHLASREVVPTGPLAFLENRIGGEWRALTDLPEPLIRRCVRIAASLYGGSLDYASTQALTTALLRSEKCSYTAEGGDVALSTGSDRLRVAVVEKVLPFRQLLTLHGETIADDLGWSLAAWEGQTDPGPLSGQVDAGVIKGALFARQIQPGDRIASSGKASSKSLNEKLARAGVPQGVKQRLPVVCDMVGVVWVPVIGCDHRCLPTGRTTRTLSLQLGPITLP